VITRIDPALGLARLRAGGALAELRADELAFTVAEAGELLVDRGEIRLGDDEIELLHARTEGWPAALVLATLWLRRVPDPLAAVRAPQLSEQVIAALPRKPDRVGFATPVYGDAYVVEVLWHTAEATRSAP